MELQLDRLSALIYATSNPKIKLLGLEHNAFTYLFYWNALINSLAFESFIKNVKFKSGVI